ncbi:phosphoribosylanthranilate isomerase [Aerococcaceae bacterium DSM 111176]|nr:phosphoribosylanthranilate isomerase [Aerococcaceae bacterium DSM 111176]
MKVKICGIRRPEDVQSINQSKPDYVGFIVDFPKSHRSVSIEALQNLTSQVDSSIEKVGVFVDTPLEVIADLLNQSIIDIAQLHGKQDENDIKQLKELTPKPIWKAFSVNSNTDLREAEASSADLVLLDHESGGTGQTFDWSLIQDFNRPYLLAGGMNEITIPRALAELKPYGIDVSSGVETNKFKDPEKIERIVRMIKHD